MKTLSVMHMLFVQDMDRAINFYEKTFTLKTLQKSPFWTNLDCGHGLVALCSAGNKTELKETVLILEVDNYKEAIKRIEQNGGQVIQVGEPYPGVPIYNVVFIDTENNQVTASQKAKE
ncbi:MAG: VOC family protein [Weeksellaceae bacterium]|nr:VOC family protein [Weeksellaceae bacterium]